MGSQAEDGVLLDKDDYKNCAHVLREGFESGVNLSLEMRRKHLKQLRDLLTENKELFCEALYEDLRKCQFEAITHEINVVLSDIDYAIDNLKAWTRPASVTRFILQAVDSAYIINQPLGVVMIIGSWNFPIHLLLSPLVGALAAGNTVLLKPSEVASTTEKLIIRLMNTHFDPGVVKAVHADFQQMKEILKIRFDHIFFTGSTDTGQLIMKAAADHLTPVVLELGGKSPVIIDKDFDLATAARRICWGKFANNGQICVAPDYAVVVGNNERRDQFMAQCIKSILEFYGDDQRNSNDYGRIINQKHFDRLTSLLKLTQGNVVYGGKSERNQLFIQPTVIDVDETDATMKNEIFGPILPVITLPNTDDAVKLIKRREKPLVVYLFSDSKKTVERFRDDTASGTLTINDVIMQMSLDTLPFGGVGKSGIGRYHGKSTFDAFSNPKSVLHRSSGFERLLWMRYPPFKGTDKLVWAQRLTSKIRLPL